MEDVLEWVDNSLTLLLLKENDLPLEVLMFIFMFEEFRIDGMSKESIGNNVFTNSFINTPIQDIGKRERSVVVYLIFYLPIYIAILEL